jgi:L,D-transpeptidase YcbB
LPISATLSKVFFIHSVWIQFLKAKKASMISKKNLGQQDCNYSGYPSTALLGRHSEFVTSLRGMISALNINATLQFQIHFPFSCLLLRSLQSKVLILLFLLCGMGIPPAHAESATLAEAMARFLTCYPVELVFRDQQEHSIRQREVCLATIYHETGAQPLWVTPQGPGEKASVILKYLNNAAQEGLRPEDYDVAKIHALWRDTSFESLARLDTLLTFSAVKYVHDVSHGQIEAYVADPELFAEAGKQSFDPVDIIAKLTAAEDLDSFLGELPPRNVHYQALKTGLSVYTYLAETEKWDAIDTGKTIRPGDQDSRIPAVRARLSVLAGIYTDTSQDITYDEDLEPKVSLFQELHGLKADGLIGRNTIAALNVTPAERVEQIRINMARWRWQDHDFGDEYVLVNIANFSLHAYRDGELNLILPVIVGQSQHQTPVFSDRIKYIEINPFWNVPTSIAVKEELPELQKNPNYLVEKNIRLFSSWQEDGIELDSTLIDWTLVTPGQMAGYKLRQEPGPTNALGQIKFVFPNHYAIYLHDTPAKNLFSENKRSFSHGCIRVSSPERLALFLLERNDSSWDVTKVREIIAEGTRKVLQIRRPMPVHLTYQTAWVDKSGRIHFNDDVYGRDLKLKQALFM